MASTYTVVMNGVNVKIGQPGEVQQVMLFNAQSVLPDNIDAGNLKHLLDMGFVVEGAAGDVEVQVDGTVLAKGRGKKTTTLDPSQTIGGNPIAAAEVLPGPAV